VAGRVPIAQRAPGWTYRPDTRPPSVYDVHQPGIATPQMEAIAVAAFDLGIAILRRGYATEDGLLFLAFMRDPRRQFVPLQAKLAHHDVLARHTRHTASAVFAVPPGARPRGFVGETLLGV
jgi:deferrochelatase/peroxidase EfeB